MASRIRSTTMSRDLLLVAAALLTYGTLTGGCIPPSDEAGETAASQSITIVGYDPVVRIKTKNGSYCTATAIHDDLLLTTTGCLKDGLFMSDYVTVAAASGANAGTVGKSSSYYVMSQLLYSTLLSGDTLNRRNFAFVKFGAGTFSSYYDPSTGSASNKNQTVRVVSYGSGVVAYADKIISDYIPYTDSASNTTFGHFKVGQGTGSTLDGSDGGAPILVSNGSSYQLVAVLSSVDSQYGYASTITSSVYDYAVSTLFNKLSAVCVEAYKDINYGNESYSLCNTDNENGMNKILAGLTFADPYKMTSHGNASSWNDTISSLKLPQNTLVTLYQNTTSDGLTLSFQNIYPFGQATNVSSLVDYLFNDMLSAFSVVTTQSPSSYSFLIQIPLTGKCLDVSGGQSANGTPLFQWDCGWGNTNQVFKLESVGSYYQIRHVATDNCLDVTGGGGDGTAIQMWDCVQNDNQLFTITTNSYTSDARDFTIKNKGNGRCLDLTDGSSVNGQRITTWPCHDSNPNQSFALKVY